MNAEKLLKTTFPGAHSSAMIVDRSEILVDRSEIFVDRREIFVDRKLSPPSLRQQSVLNKTFVLLMIGIDPATLILKFKRSVERESSFPT